MADQRQGMKVPDLFLKISPSDQNHFSFSGGRLGGLEHKSIRSFKGKSSTICLKALFLEELEICEGKGLSLRHESPLSCYTDGRST